MNRETLKKIDRFLTFGDIKPKEDETDCYYITDKAMQKVIDGFSKELLEMHRIITMNQLIEVRKRAGQVEPEVKPEIADTIKITMWIDMIWNDIFDDDELPLTAAQMNIIGRYINDAKEKIRKQFSV